MSPLTLAGPLGANPLILAWCPQFIVLAARSRGHVAKVSGVPTNYTRRWQRENMNPPHRQRIERDVQSGSVAEGPTYEYEPYLLLKEQTTTYTDAASSATPCRIFCLFDHKAASGDKSFQFSIFTLLGHRDISLCDCYQSAFAPISFLYCMPSNSTHLTPSYAVLIASSNVPAVAVEAMTRPPEVLKMPSSSVVPA